MSTNVLSSPLTSVWTYSFLIVCGHFTCSNGTLRSTWEHFQHTMWSSVVIPHWLGAPSFPPVGTMKMFIYSRSYIQIFMNTTCLGSDHISCRLGQELSNTYFLALIPLFTKYGWIQILSTQKYIIKPFLSFGCYPSCCSIHVRWSGWGNPLGTW